MTVIWLLALAVVLLFFTEVVLGFPNTNGPSGVKGRLSVREFVTRLLPLFLLGIGVACIVTWPRLGTVLILMSGGMWMYGLKFYR
jgi:hypothetical protein